MDNDLSSEDRFDKDVFRHTTLPIHYSDDEKIVREIEAIQPEVKVLAIDSRQCTPGFLTSDEFFFAIQKKVNIFLVDVGLTDENNFVDESIFTQKLDNIDTHLIIQCGTLVHTRVFVKELGKKVQILDLNLTNPGEPMTKDELINKLKNKDTFGIALLVDVAKQGLFGEFHDEPGHHRTLTNASFVVDKAFVGRDTLMMPIGQQRAISEEYCTLMDYAVLHNDFLTVRWLSLHTWELLAPKHEGHSTLEIAAKYSSPQILATLLCMDLPIPFGSTKLPTHTANLLHPSNYYGNNSPLLTAAKAGKDDNVDFFIRCGVDVNSSDTKSKTCIWYVVSAGKWDMAKLLVERGSRLTCLTYDQKNSLLDSILGFISALDHGTDISAILYKTIRENNADLLQFLVDKWQEDYKHNPVITQNIDECLCIAYEELKLKNVPLSMEVQFVAEDKIMQSKFFTEKTFVNQQAVAASLDGVIERIDMVLRDAEVLKTEYSGENAKDVDGKFVLIARFIAQNIHVLKLQLKSTFGQLPWEEMKFCLVNYIVSLTKPNDFNVFRLVLDKVRMLSHLGVFAMKLGDVKSCLSKEDVDGMFPKQGFLEELGDSAETAYFFKELHADYELMKDIYSLKRIETYVKVALQVNLDERKDVGKLVIERTLQVIGECLKNNVETPNVSNHFHKILLSSVSSNMQELITVLQDSMPHSDRFHRRLELEASKNVSVFREVCQNLTNIHRDIGMIIYKHTADIINMYLHRVDLHQTKNMVDLLNQSELEQMAVVLCNTSEWEMIKELLCELSYGLDDTTRDERRYFVNIHSLVDSSISSLQSVQRNFIIDLSSLRSKSVNNLRMINNCYQICTECMEEVQQPLKDLNHILHVLHKIGHSLTQRKQYNSLQQVMHARDKIVDIHKLGTDRGHGIAAIKERLEKRETDIWNKAQADVQRVFVDIGNKISKTGKDVFIAEANIKIKMYFVKRDLDTFFAKLIADAREPDQVEIQKYRGSMIRLGLKKDKLEELQGEYDNCNWDKCKMLVANVQNSYQTLLDSVKNSMEKEKHEISNCYKDFVNSLSLANTSDLKRDLLEAIVKLFKHNELLNYFDNRLTMLKRLLPIDDCLQSVQIWKQDKELQIAIEMLVLDLTEMLGYAAMLADNRLFIDSYSPILTGITLRNYLAHGDALIDILPFDPSVAILANALRFIKEGRTLITNETCLIGRRIMENHSELSRRYHTSVDLINIQNELCIAAKAGNLMMVREYIASGADVKACDVNNSTVAHFAVQGNREGNVEVFKYCLDQLLCVDSENDFGQSPLYLAVRHGNVHIMKYVIEELQLRVNIIHCNGMLMLNIAAKYGHNDIAQILLRNGANITTTTREHPFFDTVKFGHREVFLTLLSAFLEKQSIVDVGDYIEWTPLHYAVVLGHNDIVIDLLESSANVNAASKLRTTPLHLAAKHGHKDIATTLLDHNANIDQATIHNKTPLHLAVESDYPEVVKLLLERNASVHATDEQDFTALHCAAYVGNEQVVAGLLDRKAIVDARICDQCTALHIAAKFGNKCVVEVLLDHNASVNAKDEDGEVPLHIAARYGVTDDIVVALLERGSDTNVSGEYQKRPLHYAALYGNTAVIHALLDKNASINAIDEYMHTALHLACLNGNNEAVMCLLAREADVNAREICGWTPLHMAIFYGHSEVVITLLNNGAGVNREDHNDSRPLHLALYFGRDKAALSILMDGEAEVDFADKQMMTPLHFAAKYGHTEIFHAVLEKKVNINAVNEIHWTPLHFAAQQGNKIIVGALIKRDANVNAVDKYNRTPLHLAASFDQKEVVNALLEGKANVNAVNRNLNTPLHLAAANGRKEIVNFLLEGNAIVDHLNKDNFTPLHLAARNGHKEIVIALLEGKVNVNAVNKNYSTPLLHSAVHEVHKEVANALLEGKPYDDAVNEGAFALLSLAARACHLDNFNVLLEGEANVDASNMDNSTPLHLAASKGHREVCGVLLNKGADVLARNSHDTILHNAVSSEDAEIVQMILDRIKDRLSPGTELWYEAINAKDGEGDTPLMRAAEMGLVNVAKLLVEQADVDVHAANGNGRTVLHYAAKRGLLELVKWLVEEKCAVVGAADLHGKTPIGLALKKNHVEIVEYLTKYQSTN